MTETIWRNEFRQIEFEFEGRYATLVFPPEGTENKHWMLKTEYFGAFPDTEVKLLEKGYQGPWLYEISLMPNPKTMERRKLEFTDFSRNAMEIFENKPFTVIGKPKENLGMWGVKD